MLLYKNRNLHEIKKKAENILFLVVAVVKICSSNEVYKEVVK
jgi:hypothetical protein